MNELSCGQMFGEVSVLYGCRRTATIVSVYYGSCAKIQAEKFDDILQKYPQFRDFLEKEVVSLYDD